LKQTFSICIVLAPSLAFASGDAISYARQILPVLSENCFFCHGPDKDNRKADLRLDIREDAIKAGAWNPENPEKSEALIRIFSRDPVEIMPPPETHRTLTEEQKQLLKTWVSQGAEYEAHWAFVSPSAEIPVPQTSDASWPENPIDSFILARLESENLHPGPPAPPERWLRRVTYDLTGLPPTQPEIDAFLADTSPNARETVVDRLLASPRFGEHLATPWLDVARYADSFGYQADVDMEAWPYRDWVIKAFNDNLPLDQFIIEQLAGDLLPDATRDQILATAFNRIHRKTNEGGSVPEEFRQDGISDRVHTVGTAFMALTMECARCHDHKYDPISAKDYFSMAAFFNSIDEFGLIGFSTGVLPQPAMDLPTPEQEARLATLRQEITAAEDAYGAHLADATGTFQAWLASEGKSFPDSDLATRITFDAGGENAKTASNTLAEGKHGKGILTHGDDAVSVPHHNIRHADQAFSVSFWLKPGEDYPEAVVFANSTSADAPYSGYELLLEEGKLRFTLAREFPGSAASVATTDAIPTGEWTHVAVTNDGSRKAVGLRIFINGRPAEVTTIADTLQRDIVSANAIDFAARSRFPGLRGGMIDEIHVHTRAITAIEVAAIHAGKPIPDLDPSPEQLREFYFSAIDPIGRELHANLATARANYRNAQNRVREISIMRESADPVPAYILDRGEYNLPTVRVERETPDWLPPFPEDQPRNRLGFAKWLTSPEHPLTARVTVNRIWQHMFGRGIVATSDNFGLQGEHPSHPELLDWLARDFIAHGWDQKRALKRIALSATYAQDSVTPPALRERDPDNALLARGPTRRLSAEQLRDSALAVSGLLVEAHGGPPVKPYQPDGSMWKDLNNFLPRYRADTGDGLYRRSLYTFWRRTTTPPNMIALDSGTREVCATNRTLTNTPLQALVLLNDPQFVEAARKLAERILKDGGESDTARATWAYREVIGRPATPEQLAILTEIITQQREFFASGSSDAAVFLKTGTFPADPDLSLSELATFTSLAQALLNLDAHITLR